MIKRFILLSFTFFFSILIAAQDKWDLRKCVEYALVNNISVKQADVQARFSELTYKQNKAARLPSLNFGGSIGYRFGRSENPTTGVLEDNNFLSTGMQLQSQVSLFNWFSQKNTIEASRLQNEADKEQVKKTQNDVALNIAVAYLQILLAREQVNLANVKIQQTKTQLEVARKKVAAGILPEIESANLEAQLAVDSSSLVAVQTSADQSVLLLKALLNMDAAFPFDIETPSVDLIPLLPLADLQPELVYALATANLPQQKVNDLLLLSAQKNVAASRGAMYPSVSAFGGLSTNYVDIKVPEYQVGPKTATGATVNVGGTDYDVVAPSFIQVGERIIPLGRQFRNNFGQNVGIGLNIPILNGKLARTNWERSKLNVRVYELQKEQAQQQLKQDIYTAYTNAVAAMQKFNADKKTVETSAKVYEFALKRYDVNLLSTYDLIISQNNLQSARFQALYSQYDYVFKMKLLEFYRGQGLKL